MRGRRLLIIVPILLAVSVAVAVAFWTSTGSSTASASVGTLNAPTNVSASATPGSGTVHITWTASAPAAGLSPAGYYVLRHVSGGGTSAACGSNASALETATTCDDTAVADGNYTYTVVAKYASWTAASAPSSSVTVVNDNAPPAVTLTTPADGSATNDTTPRLSGAAGNATGDSTTVTVRLYSGSAATGSPLQTLTPTRSGASWSTDAAALGEGTYTVQAMQTDSASNTGTSSANTFRVETVAPTVTVDQQAGQADPTNALPIVWTVIFSEPVTDFTAADVSRGGTASGTETFTVSGSGANYTVSLSGSLTSGTVTASIPANGVRDSAGNDNTASTSTDNTVTYDIAAPTVTVNQKAGQADPTNALPILWTVTFNEPVTGFDATDLTRGGTSSDGTVAVTGSGASYEISLSGTPNNGTTTFSIGAGKAQDPAGNTNTASASTDNTVTYDTVGPTNSLALTAKTGNGSFLTGSTVFYRGTASGSFKLQNTVADALSGPASSSFGAFGGSSIGWSQTTPDTQTTPSGGAYVSNAFAWASSTTTAPTVVVTGADAAGNTTAAPPLTFTNDTAAPTGGSISYANAFVTALSVPITLSDGTDGTGSGIDTAARFVQRDQVAPDSAGACLLSAFPGTFATTVALTAGADTSVVTNMCYRYRYAVSDRVGNAVTYTSASIVKVDATAPVPTGVSASNGKNLGTIDSAGSNKDTLTFAYSDAFGVDPGSIVSGWDGAGTRTIAVTFTDGGAANDSITVPGLGTVNLGATGWVTATTSNSSATLTSLLPNRFVLTIESNPNGNAANNLASNFTWSTATGTAKDFAGNHAAGSATSNGQRF